MQFWVWFDFLSGSVINAVIALTDCDSVSDSVVDAVIDSVSQLFSEWVNANTFLTDSRLTQSAIQLLMQ